MRTPLDDPSTREPYMLPSSGVSVIIRFRVKAHENYLRFELMYRTKDTPTTVIRDTQHGGDRE